jgi:hypothetical protein
MPLCEYCCCTSDWRLSYIVSKTLLSVLCLLFGYFVCSTPSYTHHPQHCSSKDFRVVTLFSILLGFTRKIFVDLAILEELVY